MARKIVISVVVVSVVASLLAPADLLAMFINGLLAAFLCAVPLVVLSRFRFVRSASKGIHTLVCILVCTVALLSLACYLLNAQVASLSEQRQETAAASTSPVTADRHVALAEQEQ